MPTGIALNQRGDIVDNAIVIQMLRQQWPLVILLLPGHQHGQAAIRALRPADWHTSLHLFRRSIAQHFVNQPNRRPTICSDVGFA